MAKRNPLVSFPLFKEIKKTCLKCNKEFTLVYRTSQSPYCKVCRRLLTNQQTKEHHKRHIDHTNKYARDYFHKKMEGFKEDKDGYKTFRKMKNKDNNKYYNRFKDKILSKHKEYIQKTRLAVLELYGGKPPRCACCGETYIEFLAVDHINNDGGEHRKEISRQSIYPWLLRNEYQPDRFQVLCHNCNLSKAFYGYCPHQNDK
jgi:hypothetical protein